MSTNNNNIQKNKTLAEKEDQDEKMNDAGEPNSVEEKKDESDENLDDMDIDEVCFTGWRRCLSTFFVLYL